MLHALSTDEVIIINARDLPGYACRDEEDNQTYDVKTFGDFDGVPLCISSFGMP